jgi:hypothetical protein
MVGRMARSALPLGISLICIAATHAAEAADLSQPAPLDLPWSFGIEAGPEFYAIDEDPHDDVPGKESKKPKGALADVSGKVSLSYTFDRDWVFGGNFQGEIKRNRNDSGDFTKTTYQYYGEGTIGYRVRMGEFTLTPSLGIGYTWGATGIYGDLKTSKDNDVAYYAIVLAGDWRLNPQWTWNVFNLRYRNAFGYTWITPKVATGITYDIDPRDAVYAELGFAWKELNASGQAGSPPFNPIYGSLDADKWNIALGYKRHF